MVIMSENKSPVLTEIKDGVLILTINREERRNCINPETARIMEDTLNAAEKNPEVKVIVLTGAGNRSFCSGEDLAAYDENGQCNTLMEHGFAGVSNRLCTKPMIVAANGAVVAGGFEMALNCDMVIAAEHARFGFTEVKVGFMAMSGLARLIRDIPRKVAIEMAITGELISAQRAFDLGLVNHVVPADQLMEKTMEIARGIANNAPVGVRLSRQLMHIAQQVSIEDSMWIADRCWEVIEKTEDAAEGPRAYLEKRKPNWVGR